MRSVTLLHAALALVVLVAAHARAGDPVDPAVVPLGLSRSRRLARGHWMETHAILRRHGRLGVSTRTWSEHEAAGFDGAEVGVLLLGPVGGQ